MSTAAKKAANGASRSDFVQRLGSLDGHMCVARRSAAQVGRTYRIPEDDRSGTILSHTPGEYTAFIEGLLLDGVTKEGMDRLSQLARKEANRNFGLYCSPADPPAAPGALSGNDGHNDAFRHAYWNALMTRSYGADFAKKFATAHEQLLGNPPARESMDLYNNEQGRSIALSNISASESELATLVRRVVLRGDLMVIDRRGVLRWSDEVALGMHGQASP